MKRGTATTSETAYLKVQMRLAAVADARSIGDLIATVSNEFILHEFAPDARARFLQANDIFAVRDALMAGDAYHLALLGRDLIGVAGMHNNSHLRHLFVAKAHHKNGVGRRLWAAALRLCLSKGNPGVVTTNAANAALGFYQRVGFTAEGPPCTLDGMTFTRMRLVMETA